MTRIGVERLELPAAVLGPANPLPALREATADREVRCERSVPEADRRRLGRECGTRILPYPVLDGYDDSPVPRTFRTVVLDNGILRATVIPALGGRLWSLTDLRDGRELLARNPAVRYANVALCNAWVAGGVEWNWGRLGHHWLTSSPVFAGLVRGTGNAPALRLWEFDRVNRAVWQVDLHLPAGSGFLYACVRIVNPNDTGIPAYWWTNMAVPEAGDVRTIVPADRVLCHRPKEGLGLHRLPRPGGFDVTRATEHPRAWEGYFRLGRVRPFITAVDGTGSGLAETSTRLLRGRKMFAWGMDGTGRWWQKRLGTGDFAYLELQAGLARTQVETLPMPARAQWSFTEAFGRIALDPAAAHGADWDRAWRHAAGRLEELLPEREFAARHAEFARILDRPPEAVIYAGSGWGALEERRAGPMGPGTPFPESSLGDEQAPWIALLETGHLPARSPAAPPAAWMTGAGWEDLLAFKEPRWDELLHLGVMRHERGDRDGARSAWEASAALEPSAWSLRNLAALDLASGKPGRAASRLERAWDSAPARIRPALARERLEAMLAAGLHAGAVAFADSLPAEIRDRDRIRILTARAALASGDRDRAGRLLEGISATDLREGESALEELRAALGRPGEAR